MDWRMNAAITQLALNAEEESSAALPLAVKADPKDPVLASGVDWFACESIGSASGANLNIVIDEKFSSEGPADLRKLFAGARVLDGLRRQSDQPSPQLVDATMVGFHLIESSLRQFRDPVEEQIQTWELTQWVTLTKTMVQKLFPAIRRVETMLSDYGDAEPGVLIKVYSEGGKEDVRQANKSLVRAMAAEIPWPEISRVNVVYFRD